MLHMEHKLTLDIVGLLINNEYHTREIAKKLRTNHMTVARRLKDLTTANVLDYGKEGRNKTYHLKNSTEARNHILMAEYHKLNKTIGKHPELRSITKTIQENPKIKLAILFGSYATDTAGKHSDIDVYVETKNNAIKKQLEQTNTRLSVKTGKFDTKNPLIREIIKNHVILKGVEEYHEKTKPAQ